MMGLLEFLGMESTAAYLMGAIFLGGSAVLTVYMLARSIWNVAKGDGLSGPAVSISGVRIEGVNTVPAGEPSTPANANSKRASKRRKAA